MRRRRGGWGGPEPLEVGRSSRGLEMTQGCSPDSSLTEEPSEPPLSKAADFTRASLAARLHPIKAGTRGCRVKCHDRTRRLRTHAGARSRLWLLAPSCSLVSPSIFAQLGGELSEKECVCVRLCVMKVADQGEVVQYSAHHTDSLSFIVQALSEHGPRIDLESLYPHHTFLFYFIGLLLHSCEHPAVAAKQ